MTCNRRRLTCCTCQKSGSLTSDETIRPVTKELKGNDRLVPVGWAIAVRAGVERQQKACPRLQTGCIEDDKDARPCCETETCADTAA